MSRFPLTATDQVEPSPASSEPTREWVNAHPEGFERFMARTRRYFRLTHRIGNTRYARMGGPPGGLDTEPDWFA